MGYEIDFLQVGDAGRSGDAIAFRFGDLSGPRNSQAVVVVDGGFTETGTRVAEHIRHYYNTDYVDIVISTHPDADHVTGLETLIQSVGVGQLWMHQPWLHDATARDVFEGRHLKSSTVLNERARKALQGAVDLAGIATALGIPIVEPFLGAQAFDGAVTVLSPTVEFYEEVLSSEIQKAAESKVTASIEALLSRALEAAKQTVASIAESWHIETLSDDGETSGSNESSVVLQLSVDGRRILLTADAGQRALTLAADAIDYYGLNSSWPTFVQAPHHGSRRNVGPTVLDRLVGPKGTRDAGTWTCFVSAAPDGAPKHPSKKVTNAFARRGAKVGVTRKIKIWHRYQAPERSDYTDLTLEPFHTLVEDD